MYNLEYISNSIYQSAIDWVRDWELYEAMKNKKKTNEAIEDFDDILDYVGGWGPFQFCATLIFFLFTIFLGYVYLSPIITLYTPPHFCKIPQLIEANVTLEQRRSLAIPSDPGVLGGFSQCMQYDVNWTEILNSHDELTTPNLTTINRER